MSDDTIVADPPAAAPPPSGRPPRTTGDNVRFVLRGVGQTMMTLGVVVLLFVVYEVWITNLFSRAENDRLAHKLEQAWDDPSLALPGGGASAIPLGTGVANIYLPRLGRDYHWTIVQGTGQDELAKGPGHYVQTAMPGEIGNFGVAGHRVGKGEPFLNIDKLRTGDAIVVETKSYWWVYRVLGSPTGADPQGKLATVDVKGGSVQVPGREIVDPSAGRVLQPVPNNADKTPAEALITLTTCHPKFTAAQRMIIHGSLDSTDSVKVSFAGGKRDNAMPSAIQKLYSEVQV